MEKLKFPIGQFIKPEVYTPSILSGYISTVESFPKDLKKEVEHLSEEQLDTPYRPEGWTVRQVVNHCADSHINAFIRFKFALTENTPTIMPYQQDLWAELPDCKKMPIEPSLLILEGVHTRWSALLKSFGEKEWKRGFIHPEKNKELSLYEATGSYAWHCNHHRAHITELKKRMNWK
jgi:hypothetical protein